MYEDFCLFAEKHRLNPLLSSCHHHQQVEQVKQKWKWPIKAIMFTESWTNRMEKYAGCVAYVRIYIYACVVKQHKLFFKDFHKLNQTTFALLSIFLPAYHKNSSLPWPGSHLQIKKFHPILMIQVSFMMGEIISKK